MSDQPCGHDKRFGGVFDMPKGTHGCVACGFEQAVVEIERLQEQLAEAERLLRSVASVGYEENGTLFVDIDAFLGTMDSATTATAITTAMGATDSAGDLPNKINELIRAKTCTCEIPEWYSWGTPCQIHSKEKK